MRAAEGPAEDVVGLLVNPLLGEPLRGRHRASVLRGAHERRVPLVVATVRAGQLDLLGERLIFVVAHLERRLTRRTFAPEVALVVGRDRDQRLEPIVGVSDVSDTLGLRQVLPGAHGQE
jgi:hypothetical protein